MSVTKSKQGTRNRPIRGIVLDIDETLISTSSDLGVMTEFDIMGKALYIDIRSRYYLMELVDPVDTPGTGSVSHLNGVYRPYLKEFLLFCQKYFSHVIIYTAARRRYAEDLVNSMFNGLKGPDLILAYENCQIIDNGMITKSLKEAVYTKYPELNDKNTIAIDDRETTFSYTNPNNGIKIPLYSPKETPKYLREDPDVALADLIVFFAKKEVAECEDYSKLEKPDKDYWTQTPNFKYRKE